MGTAEENRRRRKSVKSTGQVKKATLSYIHVFDLIRKMMKTHSIVTELPFVFMLLFIAIHLQFCNVGPPNQFLQRTICDSQFWSSALIQ